MGFPSAVARERAEEDYRMTLAPPAVDGETIRSTGIYFDDDGDFVIEFESYKRTYGFLVRLRDQHTLGWRECQAINHCVQISTRGAKMNNDDFRKICMELHRKYGATNGPMFEHRRFMFLIDPGISQIKIKRDDVIKHTKVFIDANFDLAVKALTYEGSSFTFFLALNGSQLQLSTADCRAFFDVLYHLEPGNSMHRRKFLCTLNTLRSSYNFVKLGEENGVLTCVIHASAVKNDEPEDERIAIAVAEEHNHKQREERRAKNLRRQATIAAASPRVQGVAASHLIPSPALPECPYPNMWYTRALQQSGQAQVYAGENTSRQRVAIKVFSGAAQNAAVTYRLELRMLLKMPDHRNVISVLDFFEHPQPALVMHLIEGAGDMLQYLRKHGPMAEQEARQIAIELAEGVAHLHRSGIVHRDLKSANILLRQSKSTGRLTPVIIDLGLGGALRKSNRRTSVAEQSKMTMEELSETIAQTKLIDNMAEKTVSTKGTLLWMAPEMIMHREWSEKTDVFAFGIILWEMLTGAVPYRHITAMSPVELLARIAHGLRPDLRKISCVAPDLRDLIERCWAHNPAMRPTIMHVLDKLRGNDPEAIFNGIDKDGNRSINFAEFVDFLARYAPQVPPGETATVFEAIDEDGSKDISFAEFQRFWNVVQRNGLSSAISLCRRGRQMRASHGNGNDSL